jgi:hypothetical protein
LVDALYSNETHVAVEATVVFEDGRSGTIKAALQIRDITPMTPEALVNHAVFWGSAGSE